MKHTILGFICSLFALASIAQNRTIQFEKFTLSNGLTVILYPDRSVPVVAVSVLYHVGSKNEDTARTGFAHFFEHLLFEGSKNIKRGEFDKYITNAGGANNANTSQDRTFYYDLLPSNQLALGLWLESERMMHAEILDIGVETQRQVVKEEKRQRMDNQPYGSLVNNVFKYSFPTGPYHWTPIGSMEHLEAARLHEFIDFYKKYYVPNNAVLSIAGDIDVNQTRKLVDQYFGSIPRGAAVPTPVVPNTPIGSEVRVTVEDNIQLPMVVQTYRVPAQGTPDYYAFNVLSTLLSGGESSRMVKTLVDKKQEALQASSFNYALENDGIFITFAIANSGIKPEALERSMDSVVTKMKTTLVSDREFQKVMNQTETQFIQQNATVAGIAENLANYQVYFGDANLINTEIDKFRKVTKEDLRRVANKYLQFNNRVILHYVPKKA